MSRQSLAADSSDENMIRLTGLLRCLCEYSTQLPLVQDGLRKSTAMLEAGLKAPKESTGNIQLVQELAQKATLNFSLDEAVSTARQSCSAL